MNREQVELRRHIDLWLDNWKNTPKHKPVLIKGIRQSGKTYAIRKFGFNKSNYDVAIYINFWDNPELISCFEGDLKIDTLIQELSFKLQMPHLVPGKTVFIFDEVQECPRALLSLKINEQDERFDFIASGSYLGVNGYVAGDETPKPVGSVEEFDMRTMDFEEFLWAKGYKDEQILLIKEAFENKKPLSNSIHESFNNLFREYLCIGGFPEAVKNYVSTNNMYTSLQITRRITKDLQDDFGRRRGKDKSALFKPNEVARIRSAFSLIPSFLGKENKRYIVSKIDGKGAKDAGKDALEYLKDTGVILKIHNLSIPSTPLLVNAIQNQYKVFPTDIGMLIGMLEDGVIDSIMSGNLGIAKGMIYEAIVVDALYKRGGSLFYFAKDSGLELDFVVNIKGDSTILEVKATDGNTKSAKTVIAHPDHYGKNRLIRIKESNIGYQDNILTIPHYMAYLLFGWSPVLPIK
ncbi:MAG: AAA family ATPase [Bacilli bacterium]|nr:AAA family ATPase [Bacilli bacterium]